MKKEAKRQAALYAWLEAKDVAERCGGVSVDQVYSWVEKGELRAFDARRDGSSRAVWRFKPEWVDAFIARRTRNADAA